MPNHFKKMAASLSRDITLTPRESVLCLTACTCVAVACTMTGMVIGMLISPRKTLTIGSHNGCNNGPFPAPEAETESVN